MITTAKRKIFDGTLNLVLLQLCHRETDWSRSESIFCSEILDHRQIFNNVLLN